MRYERRIVVLLPNGRRRVIRQPSIEDAVDVATDPYVQPIRRLTDPGVMRLVDAVRESNPGPAVLRKLPSGRGLGGL